MLSQQEDSQATNVKICSKCQAIKPVTEYNFKYRTAGVRHTYCRDCGKIFTRYHYKQNKRQYLARNARSYIKRRDFVRQKKSRPCADCGIQYPYYVMDFDHREGVEKKYELNSVDRMTMKAILHEMEKCDVVCANCHRERTYQRRHKAPLHKERQQWTEQMDSQDLDQIN